MANKSNEDGETDGGSAALMEILAVALAEVRRDLFKFVLRRIGNEADAADVIQEFYLKVFAEYSSLRDADKLRPWMGRVLSNVIADHFRRRGRREKLERDYSVHTELTMSPEDEEVDGIICLCLYKLLPTLNQEYAQLIWRTDLVGEERLAIARDLRLSEGAFRVKLHRARQALKRRLEQTCEACPEHGFVNCGCPDTGKLRATLASTRSDPSADKG